MLLDVLRDGVRTGADEQHHVPDGRRRERAADHQRPEGGLPAAARACSWSGRWPSSDGARRRWSRSRSGIILEIPPGNIAILGVLKVALPDEDVALIQLQVNFVGILDFDKQLLSFDASLFDSHILFLTLEGDMAVRAEWGDNAGFLLSVGGFHPAFQPPPLQPADAAAHDGQRSSTTTGRSIRVESYFAVTSNTVQFGAHAVPLLRRRRLQRLRRSSASTSCSSSRRSTSTR